MADVPDWPAQQARTSRLVRAIDDVFPSPPDTSRTLRRLVGEHFPQVFDALRPAPKLGPPPAASGLDVGDRAAGGTLDGESRRSRRAIASRKAPASSSARTSSSRTPTSSPVKARRSSQRSDGTTVNATVVAFDPARDLALLARARPEPPATADRRHRPRRPWRGVRPSGRRPAAARSVPGRAIEGPRPVPTSMTSGRVERDVLFLSAALRPGDSGSAAGRPAGTGGRRRLRHRPRQAGRGLRAQHQGVARRPRRAPRRPVSTGTCIE